MLVTEIMSKPPITVFLDDTLVDVMEIFDHAHIRFIVVIEEGKLFGVIDKCDVLRVVSPYVFSHIHTTRDLATLHRRVHEIVKRKPVYLKQNATIFEAIDCFNRLKVGSLPICDDNDVPIGIVTRSDIIRHFDSISDLPKSGAPLC